MSDSNTLKKNSLIGWLEFSAIIPGIIAGIINGVVVNIDKNSLYFSFIITLIIAAFFTHIIFVTKKPVEHPVEHLAIFVLMISVCLFIIITTMMIAGLIIHFILLPF